MTRAKYIGMDVHKESIELIRHSLLGVEKGASRGHPSSRFDLTHCAKRDSPG
jgi:hypothetical protein